VKHQAPNISPGIGGGAGQWTTEANQAIDGAVQQARHASTAAWVDHQASELPQAHMEGAYGAAAPSRARQFTTDP
jgi:hypothetical protein